jgi:hypothetical protein
MPHSAQTAGSGATAKKAEAKSLSERRARVQPCRKDSQRRLLFQPKFAPLQEHPAEQVWFKLQLSVDKGYFGGIDSLATM